MDKVKLYGFVFREHLLYTTAIQGITKWIKHAHIKICYVSIDRPARHFFLVKHTTQLNVKQGMKRMKSSGCRKSADNLSLILSVIFTHSNLSFFLSLS